MAIEGIVISAEDVVGGVEKVRGDSNVGGPS
jgi:hypothetical protein